MRQIGDKTLKVIELNNDVFDEDGKHSADIKLTQKQKIVVNFLVDNKNASIKEVNYFTGISNTVITNMINKSLLLCREVEQLRVPGNGETFLESNYSKDICLSDDQNAAFNDLKNLIDSGKPQASLLYGVTGSGKTGVYLKLIDYVLEQNKNVIVLVPEISLTPQTMSIFNSRYGNIVAVVHSALSIGERLDEWKRIKNGEVRIVVGTRSAVFAPLSNVGLFIMDEEQEHCYKSENSPRYHARDVFRFRANYNNALMLLCSATPSIESFLKSQSGSYHFNKLSQRYGSAQLPKVITSDIREQISTGNESGIGDELINLIEETLNKNKQIILLLNRRGYNTFVVCRECGKILACDNCSISMVYHYDNNRLMCHYCGNSVERPEKCPHCSGEFLRYSGMGTQMVCEKLSEYFPKAKILRMDADTTIKKNSHKTLLDKFANNEYDILVGTQMVAKGLDFPNVTLVGIVDADSVFYNSDFRSYERAFGLLTQVIGRAGRSSENGIAVIQTATPENELLQLASTQNYEEFYNEELNVRKILEYPPFCDICMVGFTGINENAVSKSAADFSNYIIDYVSGEFSEVKLKLLGPTSAFPKKINAKYRYKLIIKSKNTKKFRKMIEKSLLKFYEDSNHKNVYAFADINPISLW